MYTPSDLAHFEMKKCLNVRQKLGTRSHSITLSLSQSLIHSLSSYWTTFVFMSMLKSHSLTLTLSQCLTLTLSHSLTLVTEQLLFSCLCSKVTLSHSLTISHSHSLTLIDTLTLSHSHSHTLSLFHFKKPLGSTPCTIIKSETHSEVELLILPRYHFGSHFAATRSNSN